MNPLRPLLLIALLAFAAPALAKERVALVIGNSNYQSLRDLANPRTDAEAVAERLRSLGFRLLRPVQAQRDAQLDLTLNQLITAKNQLASQAHGAEMVLVYYAGHGAQLGKRGAAHLLPVEMPAPKTQADLEIAERLSLAMDELLDGVVGKAELAVGVFDACREIPELEKTRGALGGGWRGLGRIGDGPQRILAYSTASGEFAWDGDARHSPYTRKLLDLLDNKPGLEIVDFFREVSARVQSPTGQHPELQISGGIPNNTFSLNGEKPGGGANQPSAELVFWQSVERDGECEGYREFLKYWPKGRFAGLAGMRIRACDAPSMESAQQQIGGARSFTEPKTGMTLVRLDGGAYQMGCSPGEDDCASDEKPRHLVRIQPFALGRTEVTVGEFRRFVEAEGYKTEAEKDASQGCFVYKGGSWDWRSGRSWRNPGFPQTDRDPVVCVSWNDAQAFVGWLGRAYRLPSEAEWEYATRAGSQGKYEWGETASHEYANYGKDACCGPFKEGRDQWDYTAPAGSFPENTFGLHDLHGNVWEWAADCWNGSYQGAPADGSVWRGGDCSARVVRGGSWLDAPQILRSAFRDGDLTGNRGDYQGFRVARTLIP